MAFKNILGKKKEQHPYMQLGKPQLVELLLAAQEQNQNLQREISRQHAIENVMRRVLNVAYAFMFGIVHSYQEAAAEYRGREPEKVVPVMWLAARVCEQFEEMFNHHPMAALGIAPERRYMQYVYKIANRKVNAASPLGDYMAEPKEAAPAAEAAADAVEGRGADI